MTSQLIKHKFQTQVLALMYPTLKKILSILISPPMVLVPLNVQIWQAPHLKTTLVPETIKLRPKQLKDPNLLWEANMKLVAFSRTT